MLKNIGEIILGITQIAQGCQGGIKRFWIIDTFQHANQQ